MLRGYGIFSVSQSHGNKEEIKRNYGFLSRMHSQLPDLMAPVNADSCGTVWF